MAKYFFPSSFLLFLGNWIGQITLNWYVFTLYHNAIYLGLINFFPTRTHFAHKCMGGQFGR